MSNFDMQAYVERSTAASGVPLYVDEPIVVRQIARLVNAVMISRRPPDETGANQVTIAAGSDQQIPPIASAPERR